MFNFICLFFIKNNFITKGTSFKLHHYFSFCQKIYFTRYLQKVTAGHNVMADHCRTEYENFITQPKIFTKKIRTEIISIEFSIEMS